MIKFKQIFILILVMTGTFGLTACDVRKAEVFFKEETENAIVNNEFSTAESGKEFEEVILGESEVKESDLKVQDVVNGEMNSASTESYLLQEKEECLTRVNYYDSEGKVIYYESYAYYDNGLLCSKTLHSINYSSDGSFYIGDLYTFLYLYDDYGNLKETVFDDLGWNNSDSGEVILNYEYDLAGNSKRIVIYPESESIEQEKFGVDMSKTEKIYGDMVVIPTDLNSNWENLYLNEVFSTEEPTDMTVGRFIYVDDNSEPELWMDYGYGYAGAEIFTTGSGRINKIGINHGTAKWMEGNQLLLVSGGHMGAFYDILYRIENGEFIVQAQGESAIIDMLEEEWEMEYYWNDVKVTESEYNENIGKCFDISNAEDINQNIYTYKQCKLLLQAVADMK